MGRRKLGEIELYDTEFEDIGEVIAGECQIEGIDEHWLCMMDLHYVQSEKLVRVIFDERHQGAFFEHYEIPVDNFTTHEEVYRNAAEQVFKMPEVKAALRKCVWR